MFPPVTHGEVSPSKLTRILNCPGSRALGAKYEDTEEEIQSEYAREGTHLHKATELCLRAAEPMGFSAHISLDPVESLVPTLTRDQKLLVQDCIDYFQRVLMTIGADYVVSIEKEVSLAPFHSILWGCTGTSDVIIETPTELHVIDWKFGGGNIVWAADNDQLYAYAVGAAVNPQILEGYEKIHIHVVQPRLDHYDVWVVDIPAILAWLNGRCIPGIQRSYEKHAPFVPGEIQCRWCPAKVHCRARFNWNQQTAADIFKAAVNAPDDVALAELNNLLGRAKELETYLKDIREYFMRKIQQGIDIPGWKLVAGRSNRRWVSEQKAEAYLLENFDYDQVYKTTLVTAPQAEKLDKSLKYDEEFQALIEKPQGKPTLTHEKDPRPALDFRSAEEKFKNALEEDK